MRLVRPSQPRQPWYRFDPSPCPPCAGRPASRHHAFQWSLAILGLASLLAWGAWWSKSVRKNHLIGAHGFWVPALPFLAGDFVVSIDPAARHWAAGGNPYDLATWGKIYPYPPFVARLFAWTSLVRPELAVGIWLAATTVLAAAGAWCSWKTRRALGLDEIPLPLVIAALLYSTPAIFLLERGQCDLVLIVFLIGAAAALRRQSAPGDIVAGLLLAVATYLKYYPGLLILGLLALRRWRAAASFCVAGAVIGLWDLRWIKASLANCQAAVTVFIAPKTFVHPIEHSISGSWNLFWQGTRWSGLTHVSSTVAGLAVVVSLVLAVSVWIYRSRETASMIYPYLLWIVSAATFVPAMANDYSLLLLPMAAIAVWDRRDPAHVHILMAYLLLWWQPFALPMDGRILLVCKLAGLVAVGLCLIGRTREQTSTQLTPAVPEPHRAIHSRAPGKELEPV